MLSPSGNFRLVFYPNNLATPKETDMLKQFKKQLAYTIALIGICAVCACNNEESAKTYNISSYHNDKVISADKFAALKDILDGGIAKFQAYNGIFILMDASDSTILASYATNNSAISVKKSAEKENTTDVRMFPPLFIDQGTYETGSVFKPFYVAMGLESGKIRDDSKIDTSEPFVVEKLRVTDPHGSHGALTPEGILVESSNIDVAKIASEISGEYQYDFLSKLGLLAKIATDNINSAKPPIFPKEKWINDKKYTTVLSYGYGIAETPLHIITAYSAIVNGGTYHKPSFEKVAAKNGCPSLA